jgi:hypothetical protein
MAHSFIDALLAAAILVIWQRQFGSQETGWLAAPLRLLGFVPAVIHMAWAQVLLAQRQQPSINPTLAGLAGFFVVVLIGLCCVFGFKVGLLSPAWSGVSNYLWMLILWQGFACMTAAYSHRPFQTEQSVHYSLTCIAISAIQLITLATPLIFNYQLTPQLFFNWFVMVSIIGALVLLFRFK